MRWTAALIALLLVSALAAACGDDDDGPSPTSSVNVTPAGTKNETPTPGGGGNGNGEAPDPADPTLDEQLTELSSGEIEQTIEPGGSWPLDVVAITQEDTGEEPVCTNFAFDFTWQVQDPYPPDGVDLRWNLTRDDTSPIKVSSGPAGEQTVGCGLLEAMNAGSGPFTVVLRYKTGAIQ